MEIDLIFPILLMTFSAFGLSFGKDTEDMAVSFLTFIGGILWLCWVVTK